MNAGVIADFIADDNSDLFKFKQKLTDQTGDADTIDVGIMVPLKYLNNFENLWNATVQLWN